jgi:hypothetical protein
MACYGHRLTLPARNSFCEDISHVGLVFPLGPIHIRQMEVLCNT